MTENQFDYKRYSLKNLEKWIYDALTSADASPQEIYDIIRKTVEEEYYCSKYRTSRCYELLALLNGNGKGHISAYKDNESEKCQKSCNDFWEEHYYPEEHSQYTEEEKNIPKMTYNDTITAGWTMTDDGFWIPPQKEDKVVKWQLPIEVDGLSGECYIIFPDDLLEAANLKEGDVVEWVDRGDGSFILKKH